MSLLTEHTNGNDSLKGHRFFNMVSLSHTHTHTHTKARARARARTHTQNQLLLIYNLPYLLGMSKAVAHKALPILFADDTSILLTSPNNNQMQSGLNIVFKQLNTWFKSNSLLLNFD